MPQSIPPDRHYRLPTSPAELASLFTDGAERLRRLDFNRRWSLPHEAVITDNVVRSSSILIQEAHHLVRHYPRNRLVFVTLTFKSWKQAKEASKAFNDINRRFLPRFMEAWIKVIDVHADGRDHIHAIGVTMEDVMTGTDPQKVRAFLDTVKGADNANGELRWSERRRLRDATTTNLNLVFLWAELDYHLSGFGFGWVYDCFPVISPFSIPGYLRTAYLRGRWHDACHGIKKSRRLSYSSTLVRKFPGGRVPRSARSVRDEAALLAAFGLSHRDQLREILGRRWGYVVLKCVPEALGFREALDILTPPDLARRILTLCASDPYLRSKLEPLILNLIRVAAYARNAM